jgi:hypothetical protein
MSLFSAAVAALGLATSPNVPAGATIVAAIEFKCEKHAEVLLSNDNALYVDTARLTLVSANGNVMHFEHGVSLAGEIENGYLYLDNATLTIGNEVDTCKAI